MDRIVWFSSQEIFQKKWQFDILKNSNGLIFESQIYQIEKQR